MTASSTICVETTLQPLYIAASQTSCIAPHCVRIARKPEVTGSAVGFVPTNPLVSIEPIHSRKVNSESPPETFDEMKTHAVVDESSNSPGFERTRKQIIGRVFFPLRKGNSGMKNLAEKVRS